MIKLLLALSLIVSATSCTSTYRAEAPKGSLAEYRTASVTVVPDYSGDSLLKRSIGDQLHARGISVTPAGLGEARTAKKLEVKFADHWHWDMVMYLMQCEFTFLDADTKEIKATAHYRNSLFHKFPSRTGVVKRIFAQLDKEGAFSKN